ncbi:MAG: transposase [Giesbergeria sp.]|nr:transposase [Giesbergeria sp.]
MNQSSLELNLSTKKTRKQELLAQMDVVVPWAALIDLIAPYYPEGKNGRPPFALEAMLRIHCMQQWFTLSDLAMEEAFFDTPMRPGKRKELDKENNPIDALIDQVEKIKASIRAKVEHPFRVIKRQFGYVKVRYRGLKKNTLQLKTLFALSNLWMVRHQLLAAQG